MLVQVCEKVWVDPMRVMAVHVPDGEQLAEQPECAVVVHVDGLKLPVASVWPIEKVLEQLNGRGK